MRLGISFEDRFASCLPLTMELAHLARSVIQPQLPRVARTWPFDDRVLAWLVPSMSSDIAAYHEGDGGELVAQLDEDGLARLDTLLLARLLERLGKCAPGLVDRAIECCGRPGHVGSPA